MPLSYEVDLRDYYRDAGCDALRQDARRRAVAQIAYGRALYAPDVRRESGNTYGGQPIYSTASGGAYAAGTTARAPAGAVRLDGTPIWVLRLPWSRDVAAMAACVRIVHPDAD